METESTSSTSYSTATVISGTSKRKIKHIDHYVVFPEELGRGQFSSVHKAMDKNDQTHSQYFACKMISLSKIPQHQLQKYKELLQKEIDILVSVKHENLIQLHDMKQTAHNVYLFLDFCNGGDLKKLLQQKDGRLSEMQATHYFKQLINGYEVLHQKRIIHRDLKPENILLHNGIIKIGDFGFARFMEGDLNQAQRMTQKCSPLYAPPQILINQSYSAKCDIWSLGVVFYEMLYGQTPFTGQNLQGLIDDIDRKTLQGIIEFPKHPIVSDVAKDAIRRMLTYHEDGRISLDELLHHQIFNIRASRILNLKLDGSGKNPLSLSMERHLQNLSSGHFKLISEQAYSQAAQIGNAGLTLPSNPEYESNQIESEDSQYVNYLQQIEFREKQQRLIQQIDAYFHYLRNRALYANTALLNFWDSFERSDLIPNYLKCQIVISLCCYYYYNLETIRKVLCRESAPANFTAESFEIYVTSPACDTTRAQLTTDSQEAHTLYGELVQLCIVEIQNILSSHQNALPASLLTQIQLFLSQCHMCEATLDFDWFRGNFGPLLRQALSQINLQHDDLLTHQNFKSLYMLVIFAQMERYFVTANYMNFDFNKLYDDQINNPPLEYLRQKVIEFLNEPLIQYQKQQSMHHMQE